MSEQVQEGEVTVEEAGEPSGEQEATQTTELDVVSVEGTSQEAGEPQRYGKITYLFNWMVVFWL